MWVCIIVPLKVTVQQRHACPGAACKGLGHSCLPAAANTLPFRIMLAFALQCSEYASACAGAVHDAA